MLGFEQPSLRRIDSAIYGMLPTLTEVFKDEEKWERLGLVLPRKPSSFSEVGGLELVTPQRSRVQPEGSKKGAAASQAKVKRAMELSNVIPQAPEIDDEALEALSPAKPSEEIWERHGWDKMQGWRPF